MKTISNNHAYLWVVFLLGSLYAVMITKYGFDDAFWRSWAYCISKDGIGGIFYKCKNANYLLYYYFLKFYTLFQDNTNQIIRFIYLLKLLTIPFYFVSGYYLIKLTIDKSKNYHEAVLKSLFYIANISVLYNCIVWGQIDEILSCFIFVSFYCAYKKKILPSIILYIFALNVKLQSIIFLPCIALIIVPQIIHTFSYRRLISWIFFPALLQMLLFMPFIMENTLEKALHSFVFGSINILKTSLSVNACNMWDLLLPGNLINVSDQEVFWGISYQNWGLILFFTLSFYAMFSLIKKQWGAIFRKKNIELNLDELLLIFSLIPLIFHYFNTRMHERYSYTALIFITVYTIRNRKLFILFMVSAAHFFKLERVQGHLKLLNYDAIFFEKSIISLLFLITICCLFYELHHKKKVKKIPKNIEQVG